MKLELRNPLQPIAVPELQRHFLISEISRASGPKSAICRPAGGNLAG